MGDNMNKLVWNVYKQKSNTNEIEVFNVFNHIGFYRDLVKLKKEAKGMYNDTFKENIRKSLVYHFWAKCEYEILISNWVGGEKKERKIDIYEQVMLNFDSFFLYIVNNIKLVK